MPWGYFAAAPDGKTYAIDGWGRSFLVEASTGKILFHLPGDGLSGPRAFSPDGKTLAVIDRRGLHLWDLEKRRILETKAGRYTGVLFSRTGKRLVFWVDFDAVHLWDLAGGKELWKRVPNPDDSERFYPLAFTPDEKALVTDFREKTGGAVRFLDVATGEDLRQAWKFGIGLDIHASPDGRTLASANWDHQMIYVQDLNTGKMLHRLPGFRGGSDRLTFSPNGKLLAWAGSKGIRVLDVASGKDLAQFASTGKHPLGLFTLLPDNKTVAFTVRREQALRFWNIESDRELHPPVGHFGEVRHLAFSQNSRTLLSGDRHGAVRSWDLKTGKELDRLISKSGFDGMALGPAGKVCVTESRRENTILVWDFFAKKLLHRLKAEEMEVSFDPPLALSPDGNYLAVKYPGTVALWDLLQAREVLRLKTSLFWTMGFSPQGKYLAIAGKDIILWDVRTGKTKSKFSLPKKREFSQSLAFSFDGKTLAATVYRLPLARERENEVVLWEIPSGQRRLRIIGLGDGIDSLAFSPDGATLAMGLTGGKIYLWDLAKEQKIRELDGHLGPALALAFSPDGRYLASGSVDTTILLWDVADLRPKKPSAKN